MKNKALYIAGAVILLLALTNPTMKDASDKFGEDESMRKKYNFIVCSVYAHEEGQLTITHLGVLKNFIELNSY